MKTLYNTLAYVKISENPKNRGHYYDLDFGGGSSIIGAAEAHLDSGIIMQVKSASVPYSRGEVVQTEQGEFMKVHSIERIVNTSYDTMGLNLVNPEDINGTIIIRPIDSCYRTIKKPAIEENYYYGTVVQQMDENTGEEFTLFVPKYKVELNLNGSSPTIDLYKLGHTNEVKISILFKPIYLSEYGKKQLLELLPNL